MSKIISLKYKSGVKNRGFTILESIVAIFILSLAISGVFTALQQSLSQATITKDETRAFYLAQEAVEIIRNKRDQNQIAVIKNGSGHWLAGIAQNSGDPCYFGRTCRADAFNASLRSCGLTWGSCPDLRQRSPAGSYPYFYTHTSGNLTNFKREIQLESIGADEIAVIVRITWTKGFITKEFKAKTHLLNWI